MTTTQAFLCELEDAGFRVSTDAGRLKVEPASKLSAELLARIKSRKADLLEVAPPRLPTLVEIAELDALIRRHGELVNTPRADIGADLATRRRMAPVDVLPQLTEWRAMVRAEEVRQ